MERETKNFSTPLGHKIVCYTYATAREANSIQNKYFSKAKIGMKAGEPTVNDFDLSAQQDVEMEMIRLLVREIDGKTENLVDMALDFPKPEYDFIIGELDKVTGKKT